MDNNFEKIQELLRKKADIKARLSLMPYDGSPEIKEKGEKKYLYVRKRIGSRNTSTYVDTYSDELYQLLLRNNREARELKKELRHIDRELAALGYEKSELSHEIILNLQFARANLKQNIYDQAVLEGVATSFPQTEEIIDNGIVNGMTSSDIQKIFNLKQFDKSLIMFSLEEVYLKGIVCHIISINEEYRHLLPIGLEVTDNGLLSWLKTRVVPKDRYYVDRILASMGLSHTDTIGILMVCLGLSLNDCYWVVPDGMDLKFADYNLYDNDFSSALSLVAYTGYGSVKAKGFTSSPEFTTNGMLRKSWRRKDGKILLYKGGTEGAANSGNEPFSEYYASQIATAMNINHIDYGLSKWKHTVCSTCELFTDKNLSFVPIWKFGTFNSFTDVADYIKSCGQEFYDEFCDMMIFDSLIYNTDRHQGNYGFLVDNKTNKAVAFAPVFDNGLGLFPYAMQDDFDEFETYVKTRYSAFDIPFDDIAKEVLTTRQKEMLRMLINFKFKRHPNYNLPAERIRILEKFITKRAGEIINLK